MRRHWLWLPLLAWGCGPDFDPPNLVQSVRVVGLQRTAAEGGVESTWGTRSGDAVDFTLAVHDGRPEPDEPVNVFWFSGCDNPEGDLYYLCFPQLAIMARLLENCPERLGPSPWSFAIDSATPDDWALLLDCVPELAALAGQGLAVTDEGDAPSGPAPLQLPAAFGIGAGSRYRYVVPEGIVRPRRGVEDYGLSQVFFAACSGRVGVAPAFAEAFTSLLDGGAVESLIYPLACFDEAGQERGPDHFVSGYTSVYSYAEQSSNSNPPIHGILVADHEVKAEPGCADGACGAEARVCIGASCVPDDACDSEYACHAPSPAWPTEESGCDDFAACVPACDAEDDENCPRYAMKPLLERAEVLGGVGAEEETVWIRYYTSGGGIVAEPKRLYDSSAGWNADFGTEFFAPDRPGPFFVWAAVHDNRGGANWVRAALLAE